MNIYDVSEFYELGIEEFKNEISDGKEFELSFPLPSIGFTQSWLDITSDLSEVSYCCERIAPFLEILAHGLTIVDRHCTVFKIKCRSKDAKRLADDLLYFSHMLSGESEEYDDLDRSSFYDEVAAYEEGYSNRVFTFPELPNDYWANLINGGYWEIASEYYESENKFFNKTYRKHPEHKYGFWKNPLSIAFKDPVYFSTGNWIVPPDTNVVDALRIYSGLEHNLIIEPAEKLNFNGSIILITNSTAVYFTQSNQLRESIKCVERVFEKKITEIQTAEASKAELNVQVDLFGTTFKKRVGRGRREYDAQIDDSKIHYNVSELGDAITIEYKGYVHVFFNNSYLSFEEIKRLHASLYPAFSKVQNLINKSISGKCNWNELDDETFEELCYDILFCHSGFDSSTIQKMGKSKSRDGGRDITIKTKSTPTKAAELFIFQCKYLSDGSSLSASKISNAANVIMQYGAKGYGVFTTAVIDSTLYDLLDGFTANMKIETSFRWSKYEMERYLNTFDAIKRKYFKA